MSDDHGTNDTRSIFERMSANAERARAEQAGERPSALEAARVHLGTEEPRGSVEEAMIAGTDPETGELPSRGSLVGEAQKRELERPEIIPPPAPTMTAEMEPPIQAAPESAPVVETPRAEIIEPERAVPKQEIIPPQRAAGGVLVAADELRLLIERIERLEDEKKAIGDDVKDVYAEAKARGFDTKTMRAVIKLRKLESHARQEADALLDIYKSALGLDAPYSTRYALASSPTPMEETIERAAAVL